MLWQTLRGATKAPLSQGLVSPTAGRHLSNGLSLSVPSEIASAAERHLTHFHEGPGQRWRGVWKPVQVGTTLKGCLSSRAPSGVAEVLFGSVSQLNSSLCLAAVSGCSLPNGGDRSLGTSQDLFLAAGARSNPPHRRSSLYYLSSAGLDQASQKQTNKHINKHV